jgi:hypothetical protein
MTTAGKKKGPAVAPKRGAKKLNYVVALYDYEARSDAEWSITEGENLYLSTRTPEMAGRMSRRAGM